LLQVGDAFTFGLSETGSLTKIQSDSATCGGPTSTGLGNLLGWPSTATGAITVSVRPARSELLDLISILIQSTDA